MLKIVLLFTTLLFYYKVLGDINNYQKWPTVCICLLARNKAHTLPFSLSLLSGLDYPKDRITMWVRSDHNQDNTADVLRTWYSEAEKVYHHINMEIEDGEPLHFSDEENLLHWSNNRFTHVMSLRNECLNYGRKIWADYVFMLDVDVFLTERSTLRDLIATDLDIVSPMLKSDSLYSNFWFGMTDSYYYRRTTEYKVTLFREKIGCFSVPMVHSAILINLNKKSSDNLSYDPKTILEYNGPYDDIIVFAISANKSGASLNICNTKKYGYITVPLDMKDSLKMDDITNLKLESITDDFYITSDSIYDQYVSVPISDKMGFDMVYMINLERRPDRKQKMDLCFKELGLEVMKIKAIDGRDLNSEVLQEWGVKLLPGYEDPFHKRPMTYGEIGCFLSHYTIWMDVLENNHNFVMVLEDDLRFESHFRRKLELILEDIEQYNIEWDLIYLGRKRLHDVDEYAVGKSLVKASYSYWTLGYLLSKSGAEKLIHAKPLQNMLPVDEYLPIMFNKHPNTSWSKYFEKRDLLGLSVTPLLVYPTHYTGEPGYISDTEESHLLKDEL